MSASRRRWGIDGRFAKLVVVEQGKSGGETVRKETPNAAYTVMMVMNQYGEQCRPHALSVVPTVSLVSGPPAASIVSAPIAVSRQWTFTYEGGSASALCRPPTCSRPEVCAARIGSRNARPCERGPPPCVPNSQASPLLRQGRAPARSKPAARSTPIGRAQSEAGATTSTVHDEIPNQPNPSALRVDTISATTPTAAVSHAGRSVSAARQRAHPMHHRCGQRDGDRRRQQVGERLHTDLAPLELPPH